MNLDVTTVLLAARVGVFARLIGEFGPVWIPKATIPALLEMRDHLAPSQPHRLDAAKTIVNAVEAGTIVAVATPKGKTSDTDHLREVVRSLAGACSQVVAFASLCKPGKESDPTVDAALFTCGAVVEALRNDGVLTDTESKNVLDALGTEAVLIGDRTPVQGRPLLFYANTINLVAEAGLLPVLLDKFQVRIESDELTNLRAELDAAVDAEADVRFVNGVVADLNRRLADRTVQIIDERGAERNDQLQVDGPLDEILSTLLSFKPQEGDLLLTEDRFLNSYPSRGPVPIATLPELLSGLHQARKLNDDCFYGVLLQLRAGNARYLPIEAAEIAFHLRAAVVRNGGLVETRALAILRRYVAGVVSAMKGLRLPEGPSKSHGELAVVMGLRRAVHESIRMAWEFEGSRDDAIARSAWVLANLYCPFHLLYRKSRGEKIDDAQVLFASDLASLVLEGLRLPSGVGGTRTGYLKWLEGVIDEAIELEPMLVHGLVRTIKDGFNSALISAERGGYRVRGVQLLQGFFDDLPGPIQDEIKKDSPFLREIGIEIRPVVKVGPLVFDHDRFFAGAESAINGSQACIETDANAGQAEFCPATTLDRRPAFAIVHGHDCVLQSDSRLRLLSADDKVVRDAIQDNPEWLDGFGDRRAELQAQLLGLPAKNRLDRLEEMISASPAAFYRMLEADLRQRQAFEFAHILSVPPESFLSHFGLPKNSASAPDLDVAGAALLGVYGPVAAFTRLAALPIPMPQCVLKAVAGMNDDELRRTIHALAKECRAPLTYLHWVRLLATVSARDRAYARFARSVAHRLLSNAYLQLLAAVLPAVRWIWDSLNRRAAGASVTDWQRLAVAWGHAGRVVATLLAAGAPARWLRETFERRSNRVDVETFSMRSAHRDVAHPWRQRPVQVLLTGLAYALDGSPSLQGECRPRLDAFFAREIAGAKAPRSEVFNSGPDGANALNSFLGQPYLDCFQRLIAGGTQPVLGVAELTTLVAEATKRLNESSNDASAWVAISNWSGRLGPTDPASREAVLGAFDKVDLIGLWDSAPQPALHVIDVIGRTLADEKSDARAARLMSLLVDLARHCNKDIGRDKELDEVLFSATINSVAAVVAPRDRKSGIEVFGDFLEELVRASPGISPTVRQVVENLVLRVPTAASIDLWPTVVRLRAA